MKTCEHRRHEATCKVLPLSDNDDGKINRYHAEVTIKCAECHQEFGFKTENRRGFSLRDATTSMDDKILRIPIFPHRGLPIGVKKVVETRE